MSRPGTTARTSPQAGKVLRQLSSHAHLLQDLSQTPAPPGRSRRGRPDAIVVPATRPPSSLRGIIEVAAALETEIVVLGSRQTQVEQVANRIARVPGARGLVVHVHESYRLPLPDLQTSRRAFAALSGGRISDLSVKRNLGLLLARLRGWQKIVFVDDDITVSSDGLARVAAQLERRRIAGMRCRKFADNSVFCHARRLAGLPQDVFVTGAVLGVNCTDLPLPYFPDIYNEDWFFFADAAANLQLATVGHARQAEYRPFEETARAGHEEFGDVLAEGLYTLLEDLEPIDQSQPGQFARRLGAAATERHWSSFIQARRAELARTTQLLAAFDDPNHPNDVADALKSLSAADGRYTDAFDPITPARCAEFLDAWADDLDTWNAVYPRTNSVALVDDAMKFLRIESWQKVR